MKLFLAGVLACGLAASAMAEAGERVLTRANSFGLQFQRVRGIHFATRPVTVREFREFVVATGHDAATDMLSLGRDGWKRRGDSWRSPGFAQADEHPVVGVSFEDASAFCRWLSQKERNSGELRAGEYYRLPSDAEWSAAVRMIYGSARYPWGKAWPPPSGSGNFAGEEVAGTAGWPEGWEFLAGYRDNFVGTAPVGRVQGGRLIQDLHGNVWQWTCTRYARISNGPDLRRRYPFLNRDSDDSGKPSLVIRGGCWNDWYPGLLELRCRGAREPSNRNAGLGFRVVIARSTRRMPALRSRP